MPRSSFRPQFDRLEDLLLPSFLAPVSYAPTASYVAAANADFNNDGRPDLVVALNTYPPSVGVLLGNADGTFQPPVASAAGSSRPGTFAVGDFDGDGNLDLVASDSSSTLRLLQGNGNGTFAPPTSLSVLGQPMSVAVGDFNNDGLPDLGVTSVTVYQTPYDTVVDGYATVLLADGAGGMVSESPIYLGSGYPGPAAVADFNGDDQLDFVYVQAGAYSVEMRLGDGTGQLGAGSSYSTYDGVDDVTTGDVDGDGDADLVMAVPNRGVGVLRNDGAGGFGPVQFSATGKSQPFLAVGDFNQDSRLDVAVSGDDDCAVLLGMGDGYFSGPVPTGAASPYAVTAGDFNGDSWLDLATTTFLSGPVSVMLNDHNWTPPPPPVPFIAIGDASISEGNTGTRAASFIVTLSTASDQPVTVAYATYDGSYATSSDYVSTSGTLTIPAGQTTGTIRVLVKGDRLGELDESFIVELSSPTNATLADSQGVGIILDDEPHISINDVTKVEGTRGQTTLFTFTVTLSAAYDQPVTMSFRTINGTAKTGDSDYVAKTGTLTFAAGETSKTITITVKGDSKREADEYFYVDLSGNSGNSLVTKSRGVGSILNDD